MKRIAPAILAAGAVACAAHAPTTPVTKPSAQVAPIHYPQARKDDVVDDYHGTKVADPYRWLEDPDSAETRAWVGSENAITFDFLGKIPERKPIQDRLTKLWNYEKVSTPWKEGGRYFWFKNDGLQPQSVLYVAERLDATPRVLLDPNALSADGTVALGGWSVSKDGKRLAYGLSGAGSDWQEWKVRDVDTGKDLPDDLKWIKFSGASWTADNRGFYYSRYAEPKAGEELEAVNYFQKLYYHRLGTPQASDRLVYERPDDKELGFAGSVTDDGRYLVISVWKGTSPQNLVYWQDLSKPGSKIVPLIEKFEAQYAFLDHDGPTFWFQSNLDAPRGKVIAIDVAHPDRKRWKDVIPEAPETIDSAGVVGNRFAVVYMKDAHSAVKVFDLSGAPVREVLLPEIGTATGFGGKRADTETFYSFTSFTAPGTIYRYDVASGASSVFHETKVPGFDGSLFETKQVFFASKDGTKIPMFIVAKKGAKLDGTNPTYLYGYGGFNISLTPAFSPSIALWLQMGGVFAQPNLRGGGEYGEEWHLAGTKLHKQNVFDDFIGAAEWLIANRWTSTPKLAIGGGSNGGLLVGACLTQRPDLYGAALPAVGVMDMLRFHKFTIGWAWADDYGTSDDPEIFKALYAYSPLQNVKPGTKYPPTLITTADHDDRVVPAHSFKFAATMQAAQAGPAPVLIRIETRAGHGAGKPTAKVIEEAADRWSFLVKALGMTIPPDSTTAGR